MCKLCERDKLGKEFGNHSIITGDRLAVLERDHRAMERLRNTDNNIIGVTIDNEFGQFIVLKKYGAWQPQPKNDPADAILAVEK